MNQIMDFLKSDRESQTISVSVRKTGRSDAFAVEFDEETIGTLTLMLAQSEDLMGIAQMALIEELARLPEDEMRERLDILESLCHGAHRHMKNSEPVNKGNVMLGIPWNSGTKS